MAVKLEFPSDFDDSIAERFPDFSPQKFHCCEYSEQEIRFDAKP